MNLNAIVAPMTRMISPSIQGVVRRPMGDVRFADGTVMQAYADTGITLDVQALTGKALQHTQSLNIQGIVKSIYSNSNIRGADRQDGVGGDVLTFDDGDGIADWLATTVIERWPTGWCHVAATKQSVNGVKVYLPSPNSRFYVLNNTQIDIDFTGAGVDIWPRPQ